MNDTTLRSPVRALLWEEWRLSRAHLGLMAVFILLMVSTVAGHNRLGFGIDFADGIAAVSLIVVTLWAFSVVLLMRYDRENLQLAFPARLYTLPVPTWVLVSMRMGYTVLAVGAVFLLAGAGLALVPGDAGERFVYREALLLPVVAMPALAYVEALFWTLGRRHAVAAVITGILLLWPMAWILELVDTRLFSSLQFAAAAYILALAACFAVAWAGVALDRRGGLAGIGGAWQAMKQVFLQRVFVPDVLDESPKATQLRFERRRTGRLFPALFYGLSAAFLALILLTGASPLDVETGSLPGLWSDFVLGVLLCAIFSWLFLAASGAMAWAVDRRHLQSGLGRFGFTRPVPTSLLATARLKAQALGIVKTFAPLAAVVIATDVLHVFSRPAAPAGLHPLGLALLFGLGCYAAWTFWTMGGAMLGLVLAVFAVATVAQVSAVAGAIAALAVELIVVVGVAWALMAAYRAGVVTRPMIRTALLLGLAVAATLFLVSRSQVIPADQNLLAHRPMSHLYTIQVLVDIARNMAIVAAGALAAAPLAWVPLSMHRARHGA